MKICKSVLKFRKNQNDMVSRFSQRGMTIVEYAVGAALIAAAVLVAFSALGNQISNVFNIIVVGIG